MAFAMASPAYLPRSLALLLVLAASLSAPDLAAGGTALREVGRPYPDGAVHASRALARGGFLVAWVRGGRAVPLRARPRGRVLAVAGDRTEFGGTQTFAVRGRRGRWLRVGSEHVGNGRTAWVRYDHRLLRLMTTPLRLTLDLSRKELVLWEGRRALRRMAVGIGAPESPTPLGRFAVTDKFRGAPYGPYYGCCILALSARQPRLPVGWTGGDRVGIHGTNDLSTIGRASSAGCPHARERDLRFLMRRVPLGTPVFVRV